MIGMPSSHSKNNGGYNKRFFLAVFWLDEFFYGGFSAIAEKFGLAAEFGGLGVYMCVSGGQHRGVS